jgi:hypothetical protein
MAYLCLLLFGILFAGIAMTVNEGLWSNTITLLCIWMAGVVATLVGPYLGAWALSQFNKDMTFGWYFLFAGLWLSFFVANLLLRVLFDRTSRLRLRFIPQLDAIGGPLMGIFVAIVFASFCSFTLMKAPLAAGAWKLSEATDWQKSTFQYLETPFHNLDKAWDGEALNFGP